MKDQKIVAANKIKELFSEQLKNGATNAFDAFDYAMENCPAIDPEMLSIVKELRNKLESAAEYAVKISQNCKCGIELLSVCLDEANEKLERYEKLEQEKRLLILPCEIGSTIYKVKEECDFPCDCHARRTCGNCEYFHRNIEKYSFDLSMLDKNGNLISGYYLSPEEAENSISANNIKTGENTNG